MESWTQLRSALLPALENQEWRSLHDCHPHIRYLWEPSDTLQAFLAKEIQERLKMSCKTINMSKLPQLSIAKSWALIFMPQTYRIPFYFLTSETRIILKKQVAEEKQQQAMALVIMGTVGLEKEKYRLGHTKVLEFFTTFLPLFSVEWWNVKAEGAMEFFLSHL